MFLSNFGEIFVDLGFPCAQNTIVMSPPLKVIYVHLQSTKVINRHYQTDQSFKLRSFIRAPTQKQLKIKQHDKLWPLTNIFGRQSNINHQQASRFDLQVLELIEICFKRKFKEITL